MPQRFIQKMWNNNFIFIKFSLRSNLNKSITFIGISSNLNQITQFVIKGLWAKFSLEAFLGKWYGWSKHIRDIWVVEVNLERWYEEFGWAHV